MTRPSPDRLAAIAASIEQMEAGPERIRLQLEAEKVRRTGATEAPLIALAKTLGAVLVGGGAVFTLFTGIAGYVNAVHEAQRAPFFAALTRISDSSNAAQRAGALVTIMEYLDRPDLDARIKSGASITAAERVALVLALQVTEEPSLALRAVMTKAILSDSTMIDLALSMLALNDRGLRDQLSLASTPEERSVVAKRLERTAGALGTVLRQLSARSQPIDELLDLSSFGIEPAAFAFRGANLRNVRFDNVDLTGADFAGSDVTGADFSKATLDSTAERSLCYAVGYTDNQNVYTTTGLAAPRCLSRPLHTP
jgi:hypothetical protein